MVTTAEVKQSCKVVWSLREDLRDWDFDDLKDELKAIMDMANSDPRGAANELNILLWDWFDMPPIIDIKSDAN